MSQSTLNTLRHRNVPEYVSMYSSIASEQYFLTQDQDAFWSMGHHHFRITTEKLQSIIRDLLIKNCFPHYTGESSFNTEKKTKENIIKV